MKISLNFFLLLLLVPILGISQETFKETINFESNSYNITDSEKEKLLPLFTQNNISAIQLAGHTDDKGSKAFNEELSKNRVEAVANYLIVNGIPASLINANFYGEDQPIESNMDDDGQLKNRRVEVFVIYKKQAPKIIEEEILGLEDTLIPEEKKEPLTISNDKLYAILGQIIESQNFQIDPSRDTSLITDSGIVFYFKKNTFATTCENLINIQVAEYNKKSTIVEGNMRTTSNERILFSRGMFEVKAFCENQEINLKKGKDYMCLIPAISSEAEAKNLKCFYGLRDSLTDEVNWLADKYKKVSLEKGIDMCGNVPVDPEKICFLKRWFMGRKAKSAKQIRKEIAKRKKRIQRKFKKVDFDKLAPAINEDIKYYVFQPNKMNLVNYDQFLKMEPEQLLTQRIMLSDKIEENTDVKMVFKNRRSVISPTSVTKEYFEFKGVPKNELVFIVGLKLANTPNQTLKLGIEEIKTQPEIVELNLETITSIKEVDKRLESIN